MARRRGNAERAKTETIHHVRWEVPMAKVSNKGAAVKDEDLPNFSGQPFSAVFQQPGYYPEDNWRIRNSATYGIPELSRQTAAVVIALNDLGIDIDRTYSGSPMNADCYRMRAEFLDGGLASMTGNYWYYERGAYITGTKVVLLLSLQLGLKVRPAWRRKYGLEEATLESLKVEIGQKITEKGEVE